MIVVLNANLLNGTWNGVRTAVLVDYFYRGRILLHVEDAVSRGYTKVSIRTVDTHVVILAVTAVQRLDIGELWVAFAIGKKLGCHSSTPWHCIKLWWQGEENGMGHLGSLWWCHWCYCTILRIGSHAEPFNHRRLHGCIGAFCCPALWSNQHPWTWQRGSQASVHPEWQTNRCSPTDAWSHHTTHQESCLPSRIHLGPYDDLHTRAPIAKWMGLAGFTLIMVGV